MIINLPDKAHAARVTRVTRSGAPEEMRVRDVEMLDQIASNPEDLRTDVADKLLLLHLASECRRVPARARVCVCVCVCACVCVCVFMCFSLCADHCMTIITVLVWRNYVIYKRRTNFSDNKFN